MFLITHFQVEKYQEARTLKIPSRSAFQFIILLTREHFQDEAPSQPFKRRSVKGERQGGSSAMVLKAYEKQEERHQW